jgi:hypothetical protein
MSSSSRSTCWDVCFGPEPGHFFGSRCGGSGGGGAHFKATVRSLSSLGSPAGLVSGPGLGVTVLGTVES